MKNPFGLEYDEDVALDETKPYDTISNTAPLEDEEREGFQTPRSPPPGAEDPFPPSQSVKEAISQKFGKLAGLQNQSEAITDFGNSISHAARGVNQPTPLNIPRSSGFKDLMSLESQALDRENKVKQAILARQGMAGQRAQAQSNSDRTFDQRERALGQRIESQANTQFEKATLPYITSLDSAGRLQDVLDKVGTGALTSASNVAFAISQDMTQLLTNSRSTAVSDREHAQISALSKSYGTLLQFAESRPQDLIPQEYLNQFKMELDVLRHSVQQAYHRKTQELISGTSHAGKQDIFQKRHDSQISSQPPPSEFPKVLKKDGQMATIKNEQDLKEALAEGWK